MAAVSRIDGMDVTCAPSKEHPGQCLWSVEVPLPAQWASLEPGPDGSTEATLQREDRKLLTYWWAASPPPPPPKSAAAPPPRLAAADCVLYDASLAQTASISGPIIGGQTTTYGTASLSLNTAAGTLTVLLDLSSGWLVSGDSIAWDFYSSAQDFEDAINAPGSCSRPPPGQMSGQLDYTNRQDNSITVPISSLTSGGCVMDTVYVMVHLPLVGAVEGLSHVAHTLCLSCARW